MDATRSSEDRFVCENEGSMMELAMPKPSTLLAAASFCLSSLLGSVRIEDGMLKSSNDSTDFPPSSAPLTAEVADCDVMRGPFHSGCGNLLMMPNVFVPTFAHRQIPRDGELCSSIP